MFKEFLARLFGAEPSGKTAKDRLKLVLLSDHISLAPEVVEALKTDLLAVIERYVEIDTSNVVVDFEHRDREIALTANVPILSMRDRPLPPPLPPIVPRANGVATAPAFDIEEPVAVDAVPALESPAVETPVVVPPVIETPSAEVGASAPATPETVAETPSEPQAAAPVRANGKPRSRRRRRKGTPPPASMPKLSDAAKA